MTRALTTAFKKAAKLSPDAQSALAKELEADIKGELAWDATLAKSQPTLEKLARKALRDQKRGRSSKMGFDAL